MLWTWGKEMEYEDSIEEMDRFGCDGSFGKFAVRACRLRILNGR